MYTSPGGARDVSTGGIDGWSVGGLSKPETMSTRLTRADEERLGFVGVSSRGGELEDRSREFVGDPIVAERRSCGPSLGFGGGVLGVGGGELALSGGALDPGGTLGLVAPCIGRVDGRSLVRGCCGGG